MMQNRFARLDTALLVRLGGAVAAAVAVLVTLFALVLVLMAMLGMGHALLAAGLCAAFGVTLVLAGRTVLGLWGGARAAVMQAALLFVSSFGLVFLLGAQQLVVASHHRWRYALAAINSAAIGLCNLYALRAAPAADAIEMAAFVAGGPLGIMAAMRAFRRLHASARLGPPVDPAPKGAQPVQPAPCAARAAASR